MSIGKYEDWLNRVYEDGEMLSRAMKEEIYKIIKDFTPEGAADEIMDLVYATRYEW
jgi:hypothetical protein